MKIFIRIEEIFGKKLLHLIEETKDIKRFSQLFIEEANVAAKKIFFNFYKHTQKTFLMKKMKIKLLKKNSIFVNVI